MNKLSAIQTANDLLQQVWKNRGFPVDPVTISNNLGIKVIETDLPENVSGSLIKEKGKDPKIVLHYADSDNRKRFTCAHELGHYVCRLLQNPNMEEYEFIDLRDPSSSFGTKEDEIFANQFAANLLMPEIEIKKLSKEGKNVLYMSLYFGISEEAISYRLKNLNLNNQYTCQSPSI